MMTVLVFYGNPALPLSEREVAQGIATAFGAYVSGHREHLHVTGQAILTFFPYSREEEVGRPERQQLPDLSSTSAERLLGLIDDLLDIAKIEAGRIRIEERA